MPAGCPVGTAGRSGETARSSGGIAGSSENTDGSLGFTARPSDHTAQSSGRIAGSLGGAARPSGGADGSSGGADGRPGGADEPSGKTEKCQKRMNLASKRSLGAKMRKNHHFGDPVPEGRDEAPSGRHLCSLAIKIDSSSARSGICRPDGAGEFCGRKFYKDFAPDGAGPKPRLRLGIFCGR